VSIASWLRHWVRCPVNICRRRGQKGLYGRAIAGAIHYLPGVDEPYEAPAASEVVVDTDQLTPEEAAETVLASLPFVERLATVAA
jgi:adenylylsulfate kinase-like enzyme